MNVAKAKIVARTIIRFGQPRAYADSVYEFMVDTTPCTDAEAWELCQLLMMAKYRNDRATHNGSCGFEFRLESFGSLKMLDDSGTRWNYRVTRPYCD